MNNKFKLKSSALLVSSAIISLAGATAQAETETGLLALEEVIVTAQKRAQSANDIGMSITALSGDRLEALGINDTTMLAEAVPGLTFSDTGFAVPVYTLRGVGFSENSVQAQSTVGVYNDQVAVPYPILTKGLLMDVERLEVLKGPQGTLFGRNSTGGAINYIVNKPTDEFEASASVGYGRFQTLDVEGVVSGALSDSVAARLAVRTVQSGEGWQKSVSRPDDRHGEQDKTSARLLLDIDAAENVDILLSASWWSDQSETQTPQLWQFNPTRPTNEVAGIKEQFIVELLGTDDNQLTEWPGGNNTLGDGPVADMSSSTFSATVNWALSDSMTLTSLTSFSDFENDSQYTNDGSPGIPFDASFNGVTALETFNPLSLAFYANGEDTIGGVWYTNDSTIEAFSQELRLSGQNDMLNWVAGAYFSDDTVESDTPQNGELASSVQRFHQIGTGVLGVRNPTKQESQTWAVFGHTEWSVADNLKLTAGLRYTEEEKDYTGCTADDGNGDYASFINLFFRATLEPFDCGTVLSGPPFVFGAVESELNEDSLSGKLALDWTLNEDVLAYISYSRGFKGGSFPTFTSTDGRQLAPVVQERLDAYELGVKATLLDGSMQVNAATFLYDYKDKQLLSKIVLPFFGAVNALANAPESEVFGAEFDVQWVPAEGLFISLGANYTDTEATDFVAYNQYGVPGDMSGSSFPLSPEFQFTGLVSYEWAATDNLTAFVTADLAYSSDAATDYDIRSVIDDGDSADIIAGLGLSVGDSFPVQEPYKIDATTLLGAQLGVRSSDDRWSLTLWGRNLTDDYRVNNSRRSSDAILAWTGMPRTFGVTFDYNWN